MYYLKEFLHSYHYSVFLVASRPEATSSSLERRRVLDPPPLPPFPLPLIVLPAIEAVSIHRGVVVL
jgi:hypothetical protein